MKLCMATLLILFSPVHILALDLHALLNALGNQLLPLVLSVATHNVDYLLVIVECPLPSGLRSVPFEAVNSRYKVINVLNLVHPLDQGFSTNSNLWTTLVNILLLWTLLTI